MIDFLHIRPEFALLAVRQEGCIRGLTFSLDRNEAFRLSCFSLLNIIIANASRQYINPAAIRLSGIFYAAQLQPALSHAGDHVAQDIGADDHPLGIDGGELRRLDVDAHPVASTTPASSSSSSKNTRAPRQSATASCKTGGY